MTSTAASSSNTDNDVIQDIFVEQTRQLYAHSIAALTGMPLCALALVALLWDTLPRTWTLGWIGAVGLLTVGRGLVVLAFRRRSPQTSTEVRPWARGYVAIELTSGLLWGMTGFALSALDMTHQMFIAFVLAGMVSGAAGILAPLVTAAATYILTSTLVFAVWLLAVNDPVHQMMSFLTFIFGGTMLAIALLMNRFILNALSLNFANRSLFDQIKETNAHLTEEVSERKETEHRLRRSQRELTTILENMQDVFYRTDSNGRILYASPSVYELLGYSPDELIGMPMTTLYVDPTQRQSLIEQLNAGYGAVASFEAQLLHKDGSVVWVATNAQYYRDADGTIMGIEGTTRDITERKRATDALIIAKDEYQKLSEFNRTILDHSPAGIIRLDHKLRVVYLNPEMKRMLGIPAREESPSMGMPITEISTVQKASIDRVFPPLLEGKSISVTSRYESMAGKQLIIDFTGVPIQEEGRFTGAVLLVFDATNREKAQEELRRAKEEAEAANKAKSALLANVSHELRTPLTGVMGTTELLKKTPLSDTQTNYVDITRSSAQLLLQLVNSLLDLSKIEAGKMSRRERQFDLRRYVEQTTRVFALQAEEKGLDFKLDFDPSLPQAVHGEAEWLRHILSNLISNAIKFTHDGEVIVRIEPEHQSDDRIHVHFSVRDTGIGIDSRHLDTIFDSFTQVDDSLSRQYPGTGLGTTIAKELTTRLGGRIWVESTVGKGSHFHAVIPFTPAEQSAPDIETQPAAAPLSNTPPLHILLAEDNTINQVVVADLLKASGHTVRVARNGHEAVDLWGQQPFDVIFMDVQMPEQDGCEATRVIRRKEAEHGGHTPIIAMTANVTDQDHGRCLEAGMDDYLAKPIEWADLERKLAAYSAAEIPN